MRVCTLAAVAIMAATSAAAAPVSVNFDTDQADYTVGDVLAADQFVSLGLRIRDASGLSAILADFTGGAGSDPVHLYGNDGAGGANIVPNINFTFVDTTDDSVAATTDFFSILITDGGLGDGTTATAFDIDGGILGSASTVGGSFDQTLTLTGLGAIARVNVATASDPTGYDDIVFNSVRPVDVAPIPLPAGGVLLATAVAGLGFARRRRS